MLLLVALPKTNYSSKATPSYKIRTVVIDAGHGGHDPGTLGATKTREKNIALSVALKLGNYIKQNFPDIKVVYTRSTDEFIELHERAAIANRNKSDVFISVHCNSSPSTSAYGTEVFVLGLHKSEDNLAVAKRENSVILMENDYSKQYDGFDPNSPVSHIVFSVYQDAYINQSIRLAGHVDDQFKNKVNRSSRGVKQAGFLVLWKTAMPSILIELGFITNKNEESYLNSQQGQTYMASAIYRAFKAYKSESEGVADNTPDKGLDEVVEEKDTTTDKVEDTTPSPEPKQPLSNKETTPVKDPVKPSVNSSEVVYKVQFVASKVKLSNATLKGISDYEMEVSKDYIRYLSGSFSDFKAAVAHQNAIRKKGFPEAFVVAYKGSQRVPVKEVLSGK
ncbi:MAG: N-acetylmuramoyl-L-alanine amidase [Chitinophagales bacterium]|nr:N-acetylmuramoyl-L-alanine amidase [Chitinophagales bacterium]